MDRQFVHRDRSMNRDLQSDEQVLSAFLFLPCEHAFTDSDEADEAYSSLRAKLKSIDSDIIVSSVKRIDDETGVSFEVLIRLKLNWDEDKLARFIGANWAKIIGEPNYEFEITTIDEWYAARPAGSGLSYLSGAPALTTAEILASIRRR